MDCLNDISVNAGTPQAGGTALAQRDASGRWLKGVSGNPGGRMPGVEALIREATSGGKDVIDVLVGFALGDPARAKCEKVPAREQRYAAQWLAERLWGKTPQVVGVMAGGEVGVNLTADDRRALYAFVLEGLGFGEEVAGDGEEE